MKWGMTKDEAILKLSNCMWDMDKAKQKWKATLEKRAIRDAKKNTNHSATAVDQGSSSSEPIEDSLGSTVAADGGDNSSSLSDEQKSFSKLSL